MFRFWKKKKPKPVFEPFEKALLEDPFLHQCFMEIASRAAHDKDCNVGWGAVCRTTTYSRIGHMQLYHAAVKLASMISATRGRPVVLGQIIFEFRNLTDAETAGVPTHGMETEEGF